MSRAGLALALCLTLWLSSPSPCELLQAFQGPGPQQCWFLTIPSGHVVMPSVRMQEGRLFLLNPGAGTPALAPLPLPGRGLALQRPPAGTRAKPTDHPATD